jgi:arabinan endo-1,5-alpha-L-arabinosidase
MKKPHWLLLMAALLTSNIGWAEPADRRGADTLAFVHDPVMAYEDSTYYLFCTGQGITRMTSPDRRHWTITPGGVLAAAPAWTSRVPDFKGHIWAPDIIRWHGKWWLAYSCSSFGVNTSAIGLLSADRLADNQWKDEGCIIESEKKSNYNAIDPNFIIDDKDQPWMMFGSFWDGIQLVRLDSTMHVAKGAKPRTVARRYYRNAPKGIDNPTSRHAGINAIEAPFVLKRNGWYYLFVSWDYCCRGAESSYRVVVGRSRKVEGPYRDREGRDMAKGGGTPVIAGDGKVYEAAGHNAAYHFADGDLFICHGYNLRFDGHSTLVQRRIVWDKDGWLTLAE